MEIEQSQCYEVEKIGEFDIENTENKKTRSEAQKSLVRQRNIPIELLIEYRKKGLTHQEIATILGLARETVTRRLVKADLTGLDLYKTHESDIIIHKRRKILESITDKDIKNASLSQKAVTFGILVDKQRLIDDKSTANILNVHAEIAKIKENDKQEKMNEN